MSYRIIPQDRLVYLRGSERGLTSAEVMERYAKHGHNDIVESAAHQWWDVLRDTAKDPMLWFFGGTSTLYALVGQHTEAITLFTAILPLMGMDVYLHRRTQASTEGLKSRLATKATVIRNGLEDAIDSRDLVPGDLVRVQSGDSPPADGIFTAGAEVQVDESALTGEAYPVSKRPPQNVAAYDKELRIDDIHWAFAGTRMLTGNAHIRVVFTGPETLYGEIVQSAIYGTHDVTPLQRAIGRLVRVLLIYELGKVIDMILMTATTGNVTKPLEG